MMKTEYAENGGFLQRDSVERTVPKVERLTERTVQTCLKKCYAEII